MVKDRPGDGDEASKGAPDRAPEVSEPTIGLAGGDDTGSPLEEVLETAPIEDAAEAFHQRARLAEDRLAEVLAAYRGLRQENDAYRDRVTKSLQRKYDNRHEQLLLKFIDILDNLDRALEAAQTSYAGEPLVEGLILVRTQLLGTLQDEGLERIPVLGMPFDPHVSEAVGTEQVSDPDHHHVVVRDVLRGYRIAGKIARASRVVIGEYSDTVEEPVVPMPSAPPAPAPPAPAPPPAAPVAAARAAAAAAVPTLEDAPILDDAPSLADVLVEPDPVPEVEPEPEPLADADEPLELVADPPLRPGEPEPSLEEIIARATQFDEPEAEPETLSTLPPLEDVDDTLEEAEPLWHDPADDEPTR